MRRLSLYLGALSWGSRLQMLAILLILGYWMWLDIQLKIWPVTAAIVLFAWFLGWLLMPTMVAHPRAAHRIWGSFGIAYLIVYLLAHRQWWWRTVAAHFGRELVLWLEVSCGYWFVSELRLRQEPSATDSLPDQDGFPSAYSESRRP